MIKGILRVSLLLCWSILILTFKTENVFGWFEGRRAAGDQITTIRLSQSGLTTIIIKLNPRVEIFSFRRAEMSGDCVWKAQEPHHVFDQGV